MKVVLSIVFSSFIAVLPVLGQTVPAAAAKSAPTLAPIGTVAIPPDERFHALVSTSDGSAFALVTSRDEGLLNARTRYYILLGAKKLGPFSDFRAENGRTWTATDGKGYGYAGTAVEYAGPFSPDGGRPWVGTLADRRLVIRADIGEDAFLQVGGAKVGPYDSISYPVISPDGQALAYIFSQGEKCYVARDKEIYGPYANVWDLTFSPDGRVLAYQFQRGDYFYVAAGAEEAGPYQDLRDMAFSPDGKNLVYVADQFVVSGEERLGPYQGSVWGIVFSPDSKKVAFTEWFEGQAWIHLTTGDLYGPFNWTNGYQFSPDSRSFFCWGNETPDDRLVVYMNKKPVYPEGNWPVYPVFSKNGKYSAFVTDIEYGSWELTLGDAKKSVDMNLPCALLDDGTLVYWYDEFERYGLVWGQAQFGPYDGVLDLSDSANYRWLVIRDGAISLINASK